VLAGEYDFAIPPELMERTYLEFYPNARLEVIPNSGHYPMQETPVHLATVMQEFLAETWPQDG